MQPTARFTDRVAHYVKARPGYPPELVSLLERQCGLTRGSTLVDVGCGTGLLAKLFCDFGCRVIGVEPNVAMREAGREYLAACPNFTMAEGTAETIPLSGASVDIITAGQAFHWFQRDEARREFLRVLRPGGWAALVWNDREFSGSQFAEDYEALLVKFGTDYAEVHQRGTATLAAFQEFFGNSSFARESFPHVQRLDHETFVARVLSASYMPVPGHENHPAMLEEVERIFRDDARDGIVTMRYQTTIYYGQMS